MKRFSPRRKYDVAVIGSGPAGACAATKLAEKGMGVVLMERAPLPRNKACGGGIVPRAIQWFPIKIDEAIERECCRAELNILGTGFSFIAQRADPLVTMTMRERLDFLLAKGAEKAGAHLITECRVLDLKSHGEGVDIQTTKGPFSAAFVVAADGTRSLVARKAGFPDTRPIIPAVEVEVRVGSRVFEKFHQTARFDLGLVPSGYAWAFPKREHLTLGVVARFRNAGSLKGLLDRYMESLGILHAKVLKQHASVIPIGPRGGTFVRCRTILTGDAAGLVDPLLCEGITSANLSGQMAARALIEGELKEKETRTAYNSYLAQDILPNLRWGRALAKLVYEYPKVRNRLFRSHGQHFIDAVADVISGKKTYGDLLMRPWVFPGLARMILGLSGRRGIDNGREFG